MHVLVEYFYNFLKKKIQSFNKILQKNKNKNFIKYHSPFFILKIININTRSGCHVNQIHAQKKILIKKIKTFI